MTAVGVIHDSMLCSKNISRRKTTMSSATFIKYITLPQYYHSEELSSAQGRLMIVSMCIQMTAQCGFFFPAFLRLVKCFMKNGPHWVIVLQNIINHIKTSPECQCTEQSSAYEYAVFVLNTLLHQNAVFDFEVC